MQTGFTTAIPYIGKIRPDPEDFDAVRETIERLAALTNSSFPDSPLEGEGFEPSVPRQQDLRKHRDRPGSRHGRANRRENGETAGLAPLRDQRR
jgi:hypothetical protein